MGMKLLFLQASCIFQTTAATNFSKWLNPTEDPRSYEKTMEEVMQAGDINLMLKNRINFLDTRMKGLKDKTSPVYESLKVLKEDLEKRSKDLLDAKDFGESSLEADFTRSLSFALKTESEKFIKELMFFGSRRHKYVKEDLDNYPKTKAKIEEVKAEYLAALQKGSYVEKVNAVRNIENWTIARLDEIPPKTVDVDVKSKMEEQRMDLSDRQRDNLLSNRIAQAQQSIVQAQQTLDTLQQKMKEERRNLNTLVNRLKLSTRDNTLDQLKAVDESIKNESEKQKTLNFNLLEHNCSNLMKQIKFHIEMVKELSNLPVSTRGTADWSEKYLEMEENLKEAYAKINKE